MASETADTTESTIVTMHYQRPGWFKTLKTVLLVTVLIELILAVGFQVWFYLDQQTALTYFRIYETDFKESDVQRRVWLNIVIFLTIGGLELLAINFEIFLLALLFAIWQFICCIILIRVINSDVSTYLLALAWTEMVVWLVICVLLSVFTGNLPHIHHQEQMQRCTDREARNMRQVMATSPTRTTHT